MLERLPIILFDIETTGLDLEKDRIVEYAFVDPAGGWSVTGLVDPRIPIPEEATKVHGLTDADVAEAPPFEDVAAEIWETIEGSVLAGFNSRKFDTPMLAIALHRAGLQDAARELLDAPEVDLYRVWTGLEPRSLEGALRRFSPLDQADYAGLHRGEFDAAVLRDVYNGMAEALGCDDPDVWLRLSSPPEEVDRDGRFRRREDGVVVFAFGKHKGDAVNRADRRDYLEWMVKADFGPEVRKLCQRILKGEAI